VVSDEDRMTNAARRGSLPLLPETLLVPLLDSAGDVLRRLDSAEVPSSLRPVAGFDRRGLARGAARQQLLRAMESDQGFQERVEKHFKGRAEVAAALEMWDPYDTFDIVREAAERADLPLLASMLYAARPRGWRFGLGVVCATLDRQRLDQEESEDHKIRETRIAGLTEARRRAEAAGAAAEQRAEQLEDELRRERQGRRDREARAAQVAADAERQVEKVERELESARVSLEAAEARVQREVSRAGAAEAELREIRRTQGASVDCETSEPGTPIQDLPVLRAKDLQALVDAADLAGRLASGLSGVADQAQRVLRPQPQQQSRKPPFPDADRGHRAARRTQPRVPPGMVEDDPEVLEVMLRSPRARLVVDGYNVSKLAWGSTSAAEQRERLVDALNELQMRTRAGVTVVFDGADVEGVRPPKRREVRVVFSPAAEEADSVVVREAAALPTEVPVIVASSDNWVVEHARKAEARVVSSSTLLRALRR
jgi:predicted RNA-binding protein with PIN domain